MTAAPDTLAPAVESAKRSGPGTWMSSFRWMVKYETVSLRIELAFALVIQLLMGVGMGMMYGFFLGDLPPVAQTFLVTGIPALAMFPIGFVMVPGFIQQHKFEDTYDYLWSLPVPRSAAAAATFAVYTVFALPATAVAVWIAAAVYDVDIQVSAVLIPAVLLCSLMATSVGFTMGHAIKDPRMINLLTNVVIFVVVMFTPLVVPLEVYPTWLAEAHRWLPIWNMGNLLRDGLSEGLATDVGRSSVVVGAWTVVAWLGATRIIGRRD